MKKGGVKPSSLYLKLILEQSGYFTVKNEELNLKVVRMYMRIYVCACVQFRVFVYMIMYVCMYVYVCM